MAHPNTTKNLATLHCSFKTSESVRIMNFTGFSIDRYKRFLRILKLIVRSMFLTFGE